MCVKAQLASRRARHGQDQGSLRGRGLDAQALSSRRARALRATARSARCSYVGGGKAHGPQPRSYAYRPPRKMRAGALRSALSLKLKEGTLTIVDNFELAEIKTKQLAGVLETLQVDKGSLIVDAKGNENLRLSIAQPPEHQLLPPEGVNLYDVLRHAHLVLTKDAVAALVSRFASATRGLSHELPSTSSSARWC